MLTAPLAMAQSNVTVYGVMDLGFNYGSSHSGTATGQGTGLTTANSKRNSISGINSGQQAGSRLGFRGTEDLGNGLRAGFVLEYGVQADLNDGLGSLSGPQGAANNRQAFVSLAGDFGTVALGRQYTPQFSLLSRLDPFGTGTSGAASNVYAWNARVDNAVAYVSPSFDGFNVTVAYSFNASGAEARHKAGNNRVWAISPRYTNGPIDVQLNYHQIKNDISASLSNAVPQATVDATNRNATKVWDLGGTYDFGVAKVAAIYGSRKQSDRTGAVNSGVDARYWLVGASAPVGEAGTFKISYVSAVNKFSGAGLKDAKATQWALGYDHKLSARTNLYTAFAQRGKQFGQYDFSIGSQAATATGAAITGNYKSQFQVGVRHMF